MKKLATFVAFLVLLSGCGAPARGIGKTPPRRTSPPRPFPRKSPLRRLPRAVSSDASSEVSSEASSEAASSEPRRSPPSRLRRPHPKRSPPRSRPRGKRPRKRPAEQAAAQAAAEQAAAEQAAKEAAEQAAAEQAAKEAAEKEAAEQKAVRKTTAKVSGMNFRSEVEKDLLALINEEREAEGLDPVKMDGDLQSAARIRSRELCKTGHWDHTRAQRGFMEHRHHRGRAGSSSRRRAKTSA